jgi:hypothetical protein
MVAVFTVSSKAPPDIGSIPILLFITKNHC